MNLPKLCIPLHGLILQLHARLKNVDWSRLTTLSLLQQLLSDYPLSPRQYWLNSEASETLIEEVLPCLARFSTLEDDEQFAVYSHLLWFHQQLYTRLTQYDAYWFELVDQYQSRYYSPYFFDTLLEDEYLLLVDCRTLSPTAFGLI